MEAKEFAFMIGTYIANSYLCHDGHLKNMIKSTHRLAIFFQLEPSGRNGRTRGKDLTPLYP